MKTLAINVALCLLASNGIAQEVDSTRMNELDEVVFSANKFSEKKKYVAQRIDVISRNQIARINAQNSGDLLLNTGNVFVQKSQQGGSSPVLRGFEASRVLIVVDGIRLNNAIYRSGHLQNVITVDQNMLDRVEVLYGPSSTLFGSDALGGIVHFRTRQPETSAQGRAINGNAFARLSSANNEKTVHADINIGSKQWASLSSFTFSDFGDLKMGRNYRSKYPDFGRRRYYVARLNNTDTVLRNKDDRIQKFSGYHQWDLMQKFLYQQSDNISHTLNLQLSTSSNVPRYDRLQDLANKILRYAEWYYGPQLRTLAAYEYLHKRMNGFLNEIRLNIHQQHIKESRHQRSYRSTNLDNRSEQLNISGFNLDGRRLTGKNEINFGIDGQFNSLNSTAFRQNIVTGQHAKLDSRYPDGNNNMNYLGIYTQHIWKIIPEKFIVNDGARLQYVSLRSTIQDTATQLHLPYSLIRQNHLAATGNIGLVYLPAPKTKLSVVIASGFRSPNIDDLSKIFESSTSNRQLIVPNPNIRPEYTYNLDISLEHRFSDKFTFTINGFHTWFLHAIVVAPYRVNGQDSILYNGVTSAVLASQNRNKARLYGTSGSISGTILPGFSYQGTMTFTRGRFHTDPAERSSVYQLQADGSYKRVQASVSTKPLDHIPPLYGRFSLKYIGKQFSAEAYTLFNGWKRISDYNADGEDNAQYATPDGMPSWYTVNFRTEYVLGSRYRIQGGIENLLDRNYRSFASGFSAPGRNFWLSLRTAF